MDAITPSRDAHPRLANSDCAQRSWLSPFTRSGASGGLAQLPRLLTRATQAALAARRLSGPLPADEPGDVLRASAAGLDSDDLPLAGIGADAALACVAQVLIAQVLVEHGIDLSHARAAIGLQPPPLGVSVSDGALASVSNASRDSDDAAPSAIAVERWVMRALSRLSGLGARADGVMTASRTLSNVLGLLLARDATARHALDGAAALQEPVVLCSELCHFSVHRACAALGLGERAARAIPTDARHRMKPGAVRAMLSNLSPSHTPLAIVATVGTPDFGSIDPLPELAEIAAEHGVWLHVDAAYGFGALLSERLAPRLCGIERADSITLDLHKFGWQPTATSVLLVADTDRFVALDREVEDLNLSDDSAAGRGGRLGRSLRSTRRRPDARRVATTFLTHGRRELGDMVDTCHDLARHAERRIAREPELELIAPAELSTVVFRYRGQLSAQSLYESLRSADEVNAALRRKLLARGIAAIGRTSPRNPWSNEPPRKRVWLKLTLLDPAATPSDIDDLIDAVLRAGREAERQWWRKHVA